MHRHLQILYRSNYLRSDFRRHCCGFANADAMGPPDESTKEGRSHLRLWSGHSVSNHLWTYGTYGSYEDIAAYN